MANKPVMAYWKIRGLAHPIRFLFQYLDIDFEDKYYDFTPENTKGYWYADREKLNLPLPNVPYLLDGPHKITESRAILKHLCRTRKPELLGTTPEIQARIDMVDNFIYDVLYTMFIPLVYHYTEELHEKYKELLPVKLGYLQDFLGDNKWIAGSNITYVDFFAYEVVYQLTVFDSKCLDKFPKLQAYLKRFEELPAIKAYMATPNYLKAPLYTHMAKVKI